MASKKSTVVATTATAQERFNFSGTASEIARQVAIKANLPQLLHAANAVEWDDYEHSIRGKTIPEALAWLSHSWPALESAITASRITAEAAAATTEEPPDPRYQRAYDSLAAFCQLMMKRFKLRPVTRLIIAKLEEATRRIESGQRARLIVSVPPRIGKTQLVSRLFPAWFMGRNPHLSTMSATLNAKNAGSIGDDVLGYIKHPDYAKVFPRVSLSGSSKSKTEFKLFSDGELGGEYGSYGRGGGYTGRGAHLLIVDDLMKETEVDSEAVLSEAHKAVQALSSRLDPEDVTCWIIVNTRYRENDVIGYVLSEYSSDGPWEVVSAPLIADHTLSGVLGVRVKPEDGEAQGSQGSEATVEAQIADHVLPPQLQLNGEWLPETVWHREDGDVLEPYKQRNAYARREMLLRTNPQEWWGQYQCSPVAATGNMVDPSWFGTWEVTPQALLRATYARLFVSVDTGEGKSVTGARSAIGIYGEPHAVFNKCPCLAAASVSGPPATAASPHCKLCRGSGLGAPVRILEILAYPWQSPDQVLVLKAIADRWRPDVILIEDKSTGPGVAQTLRRDTDWVRCPIQMVEPRGDKVVRMSNALPSLRDGQYALPSDSLAVPPTWTGVGYTPGVKWTEDFRGELLHFPRSKFKDRADQLSQAVNYRTVNPMAVASSTKVGGSWAQQSQAVSRKLAGGAFRAF